MDMNRLSSLKYVFLPMLLSMVVLAEMGTLQTASRATTPVRAPSTKAVSNRVLSFQHLRNLDCRGAILKITPTVIRDSQKDLKNPGQAKLLAFDLQYVAKALSLDENEFAAAQVMRIANTLAPDNLAYQAFLAENLSRAGRVAEARKIFDNIGLDKTVGPDVVVYVAQFALRSANSARARAIVEQYASNARCKSDPHYLSVRARIWLKSGFAKQGASFFRDAIAKESSEYCKNLWLVVVNTLDNNGEAARDAVLAAGKILPRDPLWLCDASSAFVPVDRQKSLNYLKQSLQCERLCSRAFYSYADSLKREHNYAAALNCLEYLEKLRPYSAEVCFAKARVLRAQAEFSKARELIRKGIALNPGAASAYIEMASIFSEEGKPEDARAILHEGTQLFPYFSRVWQKEGDLLAELGKLDLAEKSYRQALSVAPQPVLELNDVTKNDIARVHASLAWIAYKAGQRPQAIQEATLFNELKLVPQLPAIFKMINIRPSHFKDVPELKKEVEIRQEVLLADALYDCRDLDDAIAEYKKAVALNPDDSDLRSYMLNLLTEKGDWSSAASEDLSLTTNIVRKIPENIGNFFGKKNQ
jgi:tetratricopeptide (TPR) repeat protein